MLYSSFLSGGHDMRTAIVTGGSGGIGSAICRSLCAEGYNVAVCYNSGIDAAVQNSDLTDDQLEIYEILLITQGNKDYLFE